MHENGRNSILSPKRKRGRPKTMSDDDRRVLIVATATELFISNGYGGTTMDEIAASCRVSKRTLYSLFEAKTELFVAIVEAHRQSMLALPGDYDDLPTAQALERIFRVDIDPEADRDRMALLQLVMGEATRFPELGSILRVHGAEPSHAALAAWIESQQRRGRIVALDADSAAWMLMDMVFGPASRQARGPCEGPRAEERRDYQRQCIRIFLDGACPR